MKLAIHMKDVIDEVNEVVGKNGLIAEVVFDGSVTTTQTLAGDGDSNYESLGVKITVVVGGKVSDDVPA